MPIPFLDDLSDLLDVLDDAADGIDAAIDQLVEDDRADPAPDPPPAAPDPVPTAPTPPTERFAFRPGPISRAATPVERNRPELTKRPNFTYRVKIDISAFAEKPQVANFRTTGQTDRVYRTVFKVSLRP